MQGYSIIILLGLAVYVSSQSCPSGFVHSGTSCYHIGREIESWSEAVKMCEIHGANLVALETDEEYKRVIRLMSNYYAAQEYWVAGSDWGVDGQWVWEPSGTPVTTDHWFLSDPNGGSGEECMSLKRVLGFQWTDDNCTLKKNYVCEKSEGDSAGNQPGPVMGGN